MTQCIPACRLFFFNQKKKKKKEMKVLWTSKMLQMNYCVPGDLCRALSLNSTTFYALSVSFLRNIHKAPPPPPFLLLLLSFLFFWFSWSPSTSHYSDPQYQETHPAPSCTIMLDVTPVSVTERRQESLNWGQVRNSSEHGWGCWLSP